jgi:hypothetical protein
MITTRDAYFIYIGGFVGMGLGVIGETLTENTGGILKVMVFAIPIGVYIGFASYSDYFVPKFEKVFGKGSD